jgi:hypothetical protein
MHVVECSLLLASPTSAQNHAMWHQAVVAAGSALCVIQLTLLLLLLLLQAFYWVLFRLVVLPEVGDAARAGEAGVDC